MLGQAGAEKTEYTRLLENVNLGVYQCIKDAVFSNLTKQSALSIEPILRYQANGPVKMLLTKLSSILVASSTASACMSGFSHGIIAREIQAGNLNTKRRTNLNPLYNQASNISAEVSTTRLLDSNTTHWTPADNMRQMQRTDDAFNARDFGAAFNHHPNITVYNPMNSVMNLAEHLQDLRLTFSTYSDAAPHNHDYRVVFAEGDWTVAATRAAGTNDGPLQGPTGEFLPPTDKPVAYSILTVAHWQDGLILEEYLWSDLPSAYR